MKKKQESLLQALINRDTLIPEVLRLRLHAYVRVCSTELQLQPCSKFFNSSKYGFFRQIPVRGPTTKVVNKQNDQYLDFNRERPCLRVSLELQIVFIHSIPESFCAGTKNKVYRIGLLFGDFGPKKQRCDAPIPKQESQISERCSYFTGQPFVSARKTIKYSVDVALNIAFVLVVAVRYFTVLHSSKLYCVTYTRLPAI